MPLNVPHDAGEGDESGEREGVEAGEGEKGGVAGHTAIMTRSVNS